MVRRLFAIAALISAFAVLAPATSAAGARLIAPVTACPNQDALDAPAASQELTMLCMTNYAREQFGEPRLETSLELEQSAHSKSRDVLRCNEFSHYACGREFTYWMRSAGYLSAKCWRAGENLAWGVGPYSSVGSIFRALMRSTAHRENILGDFAQVGIDLQIGSLDGRPGTRVWTQHFGSHC